MAKLYCGTGAVSKRNGTAYTGETNPISFSNNIAAGTSATRFVSSISTAVGATITQAELQFTWTPVGTAGAADSLNLDDVQLQVVPAGLTLSAPLLTFERSDVIWDLLRCQHHAWAPIPNGQFSTALSSGQNLSTTAFSISQLMPVRMRTTPTMTISFQPKFLFMTDKRPI